MRETKAFLNYDVTVDDFKLFVTVKDRSSHTPNYQKSLIVISISDAVEEQLKACALSMPEGREIAEALMEELWAKGFRPRGFSDTENEVKALKDHLGDMKTITFSLLEIKE